MGKSFSSVSSVYSTSTEDNRQVVDGDSVGVTAHDSNITVNALDSGIVKKALDTITSNDASLGDGFSKLLNLAGDLFKSGTGLIEKTQNSSLAQLETINSAANDKTGAIDQKTIIVLAIAAAVALVMTKGKF